MSFHHAYPPSPLHATLHRRGPDNFDCSALSIDTPSSIDITEQVPNQGLRYEDHTWYQDPIAIIEQFDAGSWCTSLVDEGPGSALMTASEVFSEGDKMDKGSYREELEYDLVLRNEVPPPDFTRNEYYTESIYGHGPASLGDPHYYPYQVRCIQCAVASCVLSVYHVRLVKMCGET